MYISHARLCVCVCLSDCPRPHAHTTARTRMQLVGMIGSAPLGGFAIGAHDSTAANAKCQRLHACTPFMPGLHF